MSCSSESPTAMISLLSRCPKNFSLARLYTMGEGLPSKWILSAGHPSSLYSTARLPGIGRSLSPLWATMSGLATSMGRPLPAHCLSSSVISSPPTLLRDPSSCATVSNQCTRTKSASAGSAVTSISRASRSIPLVLSCSFHSRCRHLLLLFPPGPSPSSPTSRSDHRGWSAGSRASSLAPGGKASTLWATSPLVATPRNQSLLNPIFSSLAKVWGASLALLVRITKSQPCSSARTRTRSLACS
mmetsp:Transcript_10179/g.28790  ORF Transcript_10179/g.28790 Transcript_10179/m.28790 type:complete len:243 (-) Transcript_10179:263-991(-)